MLKPQRYINEYEEGRDDICLFLIVSEFKYKWQRWLNGFWRCRHLLLSIVGFDIYFVGKKYKHNLKGIRRRIYN